MNQTGTYLHVPGQGWVKVSEAVPRIAPSCYVPKVDIPHYDRSAMRHFESKAEKRVWMKQYGLKEGGVVKPNGRIDGHWKSRPVASPAAKRAHRERQAKIQAQGGVNGLLDRIQQGRGHFV